MSLLKANIFCLLKPNKSNAIVNNDETLKYDFDVTNQCSRYGVERGLICNKLMRRMLFEGFFYWLITFIELDSHLFQLVYSFLSIRALCSGLYLRYAFLFNFLLFFSF